MEGEELSLLPPESLVVESGGRALHGGSLSEMMIPLNGTVNVDTSLVKSYSNAMSERFHLYSDHIVELGLYILLYIASSLRIFTHVFSLCTGKGHV